MVWLPGDRGHSCEAAQTQLAGSRPSSRDEGEARRQVRRRRPFLVAAPSLRARLITQRFVPLALQD